MALRSTLKAPAGLSRRAQRQWDAYLREYKVDDAHGLFLLATAMRAFDEMNAALADVEKNGAVYVNRHGEMRANPSSLIADRARAAMLRALHSLHFDLEPKD